jgi:hypothetical protein
MPVGKITKSSVEAMKPAAVDQYLLDRELKGFGVNCTPRPPVLPCPISAARPARPDRLVDPAGADRRIRCPGTGSQRRSVLRLPDPPLRSSPDAYVYGTSRPWRWSRPRAAYHSKAEVRALPPAAIYEFTA